MHVDIRFPLKKVLLITFERVTTPLRHALPRMLWWYIFSQFSMVLGYLQRVATHYLNILEKINMNI